MMLRMGSMAAALLGISLIAACTSGAPHPNASKDGTAAASSLPSTAADYRAVRAAHAGNAYQLDAAASDVRIYAYRDGSLGFVAGHNHVIRATHFSGFAFVPEQGMASAKLDIIVPLADLQIDDPTLRTQTGGTFEGEISAGGIEGTREHMLGEHSLQAERYPQIRLSASHFSGELPKPIAELEVELHGVRRSMLVPMTVSASSEQLRASGAFALRQSDFGITPYSVLGGTLGVQDIVSIEFTVVGRPLSATP